MVFNGSGGQLFVKYLLFVLLTPITLGIYALFFPVKLLRTGRAACGAAGSVYRVS